jgi:hypothetical protein
VSGDGPAALHKPRLAFFTNSDKASDDSPAGKVRSSLTAFIPKKNFNTLLAPYRIVFVSARATFSLSMIDGLRPEGNPDGDTMRRNYVRIQQEDGRSYQTRVDVRWKILESAFPFKGFQLLKAQLLGALATRQMEVSALQGLTLIYDLHMPGDRQGRLAIGKDLDEATYIVHDDARVEGALRTAIANQEAIPFEYGPSLRDLTRQIEGYGLTDKLEPVNELKAKDLLRNYIMTVPGLKENYDVAFVAPTKQSYYRPASPGKPEGYYCTCGAFIMDMASIDEFPQFCKCGNRLRFD